MSSTQTFQKRIIIGGVLGLFVIGIASYAYVSSQKTATDTSSVIGPVTFISAEEDTSITVIFDTEQETARMTGLGYTDLLFTQTISASGARYEHEETGLVLWNKGDEITIFENDEPMFVFEKK